jgi:hypothetical protein
MTTAFLACLLGIASMGLAVFLAGRAVPRSVLRDATLLLLLPGLAGAWLLSAHGKNVGMAFLQGMMLSPACLLSMEGKRDRALPALARTAAGLGADRAARLRWLWLPLLGPPAFLSLFLSLGLSLAAASGTRW